MIQRQFVSYPKSGRTWIRFILSRLDCEQLIKFHHDQFEFSDGSRPPHSFCLSSRLLQYAKIERLVYLERDPRDVMVSLYRQITGRMRDQFDYCYGISDFIRDDYFGAANLRQFRDMWNSIADRQGFLKVSYEACHSNAIAVLRQILSYYEIEISETQLSGAVADGTFENMKSIESSMQFAEPWLRYRNGSPKVRQGKVGGFRDVLTKADISFLNEVFDLS